MKQTKKSRKRYILISVHFGGGAHTLCDTFRYIVVCTTYQRHKRNDEIFVLLNCLQAVKTISIHFFRQCDDSSFHQSRSPSKQPVARISVRCGKFFQFSFQFAISFFVIYQSSYWSSYYSSYQSHPISHHISHLISHHLIGHHISHLISHHISHHISHILLVILLI